MADRVPDQGPSGSEATRAFYDAEGWQTRGPRAVDTELFGTREDGPIRIELNGIYLARRRRALEAVGTDLDLLECGCGGTPAVDLLPLCARYTGIDFSDAGLAVAAERLSGHPVPREFQKADVCDLPFEDNRFDAVYSANMIYHLDEEPAQARAMQEMLRVVRPGGCLLLLTANPFPLAFPGRLVRRLIAVTPGLGAALQRRRSAILPYRPMPLWWYRRQVGDAGTVRYISAGMPSTHFLQQVTEHAGVGRLAWRGVRWLETNRPRLAVPLGNYTYVEIRPR